MTWQLKGTMSLIVTDTAGAGDLVRTTANIQEVHLDNSTCSWRIGSQYFYLTPPEISVVNETGNPVPLMGEYFVLVKLAFDDPQQHLSESTIELRTPSEASSREVILTIQSAGTSYVTGVTPRSQSAAESVTPAVRSTYVSFQSDVAALRLPVLQRDVINFSRAEAELRFGTRAEDYSQLRDGNVVDVGALVQFGVRGVAIEWRGVATDGTAGTDSDASGARGGSLIWVSSLPVTLQCPPPGEKRPELLLQLTETTSCAYDGNARAGVAVALTHGVNSTATAYNITVRVYLSDVMRLLAYANSVLRQNSLSVVQNDSVVTIDIARMTFSDPTTVTLTLSLNLSDPLRALPDYHVIPADASFADRWGNDTDMFADMQHVKVHFDKQCSGHVSWRTSGQCTCNHDVTRSDCACCVAGACQCGEVNPNQCVPCQHPHYCQPFLPGFDTISELTLTDGVSSIVCDPFHRYRPWTSGISCYEKGHLPDNTWNWTALTPVVGAILYRDVNTGTLYGVSNNGLARMRSVDGGVTWYTLSLRDYQKATSTADLVNSSQIATGIEF
ncbi:uncharacterized protein LOC112572082 isoform X2 [Pomacea canaliculata]|uniref:uncharacterized protein LOC112572082 isoform X2 n=1 Tax=Pomacea canaliculata TaxID=400727 RepID=UPI000D738830|nr:uncharacterized protein LOC112572082 isoform X2 [Pomacea canaliculata]